MTAFRHRRPFNRVYYLPQLIYRVYNILTAYPQTAYLVHNHNYVLSMKDDFDKLGGKDTQKLVVGNLLLLLSTYKNYPHGAMKNGVSISISCNGEFHTIPINFNSATFATMSTNDILELQLGDQVSI